MRLGPGFIFFGAVLGSCLVSVFGYAVTAGATLPPVTAAVINDSPAISQQVDQPAAQVVSPQAQAGQAGCALSPKFPPEIQQWCSLITAYAFRHGLQPDLIAAVMMQESGGNPLAYSRSGAVGLMQVMPSDGLAASFVCANGPCFANRPTTAELQDPEFNVKYGARMLSSLVKRHGDVREALKSYGPMDVGYYYADKVLGILAAYGQ